MLWPTHLQDTETRGLKQEGRILHCGSEHPHHRVTAQRTVPSCSLSDLWRTLRSGSKPSLRMRERDTDNLHIFFVLGSLGTGVSSPLALAVIVHQQVHQSCTTSLCPLPFLHYAPPGHRRLVSCVALSLVSCQFPFLALREDLNLAPSPQTRSQSLLTTFLPPSEL